MSLDEQGSIGPRKSATIDPLERLYTRDEVAERYHVNPRWVTVNYRKLGLKPMRVGKRILFPASQLIEADRRALGETA